MARYQIQIKNALSADWSEWFEGMDMRVDEQSNTILEGDIPDQSALFGLLKKIRDLGLELISVNSDSGDVQQDENF